MTAIRPKGMHPAAFEAFLDAGVDPGRIGQTVGDAPASAGVHEPDGTLETGEAYCAATDLRLSAQYALDDAGLKDLLWRLGRHGFAAFYRNPGADHWPAGQPKHVHIVYAGVPMKQALRDQVHAYCHDPMLNGLLSNVPYEYCQPDQGCVNMVRALFLTSGNPIDD